MMRIWGLMSEVLWLPGISHCLSKKGLLIKNNLAEVDSSPCPQGIAIVVKVGYCWKEFPGVQQKP